MATRSLNKVILIGNLTRDPELRYTPSGTPVCSFGLATNRSWVPSGSEERQEETEFHSVVAWSKLAELCAQLLSKGRKVYIEGRLQTRSWETTNGEKRTKTEIVAEDMIILDNRKSGEVKAEEKNGNAVSSEESLTTEDVPADVLEKETPVMSAPMAEATPAAETQPVDSATQNENIDLDKIPF